MGEETVGRIRDEYNPILRVIAGLKVVIVCWLAGNLGDHGSLALSHPGDFVELPVKNRGIHSAQRRTHDHAENRLGAAPVHERTMHCDAGSSLKPARIVAHIHRAAVACGFGEIFSRAVRIANPQGTATPGMCGVRLRTLHGAGNAHFRASDRMVEHLVRQWHLRDVENRIGGRGRANSIRKPNQRGS